MKKAIVLLGVGSTYFTRGIIESLIMKGGEWDVRMVDIDPMCLDIAVRLGQRLVEAYDAPITIQGSLDRRDMLAGADAVVSTVGVGGRKAWLQDVQVPRAFNIYQSTGDTYGAGGVSRALRMIPALVEIAQDIERYCPQALFVNFSNPMSVNCRAVARTTSVQTIGLCYGVTWYEHQLASFIGVPYERVSCRAVGVNHFTWITDFFVDGADAWPLVREKLQEKGGDSVAGAYTWELFRMFDAFPCVGDGHICEFVPGWQGEGAYYGKTFGMNVNGTFEEYYAHWDEVFEDMAAQADGRKPLERRLDDATTMETFRDEDLFIDVLNAWSGGQPICRTVNLPNKGQAANLPQDIILESTTLISGAGFEPLCLGEVPLGIAAIMQRISSVQELTVEAALRADRKLVMQALLAGETVKTEAEAATLTDALLDAQREWLPQFYEKAR